MSHFDAHFLTGRDDAEELRDLDLAREAPEVNPPIDDDHLQRSDYDAGSDQELADHAHELEGIKDETDLLENLIAAREEEDQFGHEDPNRAANGTSEAGDLEQSDHDLLNEEGL